MHGKDNCNEHKDDKKFWIVKIDTRGFEGIILMYGMESEMLRYIRKEFGYTRDYRSVSNSESAILRALGMKAYLC